jgi:hypothetical protein
MTEEITPFSPEALKREVQTALNDASIYDIRSYGWLNEHDADPEFIGHAMWQIDQPPLSWSTRNSRMLVRFLLIHAQAEGQCAP